MFLSTTYRPPTFHLTQMAGHAMLMGVLTRKGPHWNFRALGEPATGRTIKELLQNPKNLACLSENPSFAPELRHVTVTVLSGRGLAAKDRASRFSTASSSDPYYSAKFKGASYTSEVVSRTLEPEWKPAPFELGWIMESDPKSLKVEVFDHDQSSSDDFMGVVKIHAHALFSLGFGHHMFWFPLSGYEKKKRRSQSVSGELLLEIKVEPARQ